MDSELNSPCLLGKIVQGVQFILQKKAIKEFGKRFLAMSSILKALRKLESEAREPAHRPLDFDPEKTLREKGRKQGLSRHLLLFLALPLLLVGILWWGYGVFMKPIQGPVKEPVSVSPAPIADKAGPERPEPLPASPKKAGASPASSESTPSASNPAPPAPKALVPSDPGKRLRAQRADLPPPPPGPPIRKQRQPAIAPRQPSSDPNQGAKQGPASSDRARSFVGPSPAKKADPLVSASMAEPSLTRPPAPETSPSVARPSGNKPVLPEKAPEKPSKGQPMASAESNKGAPGFADLEEKNARDMNLCFQALVWSETVGERMVLIDGAILRTGDKLSNGERIRHIDESFIVLEKGEKQWRLKFQSKK